MEKTKKPYLWLLGVNLFISTFTFGGGYVVVPMIRRYFVERRRCFTEEELVSMAAVAQSTPGAIAINLSAQAGFRTAGLGGAVLSCIAAILPPRAILGLVSAFYAAFAANAVIAEVGKVDAAASSAVAAVLLLVIYGGYFLATALACRRMARGR